MINHQHPATATCGYDKYQKGFVVQATEDISKGREVLVNYNEINKDVDLFFNYGVVH